MIPIERQTKRMIYRFVCHWVAAHDGRFPTYREIRDGLSLNTTSTVGFYLEDLVSDGLLVAHGRGRWQCYSITGQRIVLPETAAQAANEWATL